MARLSYVRTDALQDQSLADLVERIRQQRSGSVNELYRMLLNSPSIADGWLRLGTAVRFEAQLDGRSRELAICRVGQLNGAQYEWDHHVPLARREGITDGQVAALGGWRSSDQFDARERAVLDYADAMTRDVAVPDDVFETLRTYLGEREILELTATIGFYNMVSRVLVALRIADETD
ncbi:MAG TPA: carboxymuconolactone decarboxylase family protein [Chloroflexota bacterium]|nr:carboxymuconolactone decarboxylase family protein [Chloroflexota bacterium]